MKRRIRLVLCLLAGFAFSVTSANPTSLPPIGLAVPDDGSSWCVEVRSDSATPPLAQGRHVTIVFGRGPAHPAGLPARVLGRRAGQCETAFPQLRWESYVAYDLELLSPPPDVAMRAPIALMVASPVEWVRGADDVPRADLDGDGHSEELRSCFAGEGEHLSVWSARPGTAPVRRWHEYFDWGAAVDQTCGPGEGAPRDGGG